MSRHHSARKAWQDATDSATKARAEAKKAVAGAIEAGREGFLEARQRVEVRGQELQKSVSEAGEEARRRYDEAVTSVRQGVTTARKSLVSLGSDVHDYARENVGKAMLVAGVAGFLAGIWAARKLRASCAESQGHACCS